MTTLNLNSNGTFLRTYQIPDCIIVGGGVVAIIFIFIRYYISEYINGYIVSGKNPEIADFEHKHSIIDKHDKHDMSCSFECSAPGLPTETKVTHIDYNLNYHVSIKEWCEQNCYGKWHITSDSVSFSDKTDLVLFKLLGDTK